MNLVKIGYLCNFYWKDDLCAFLRKLSELLTRRDFAHLRTLIGNYLPTLMALSSISIFSFLLWRDALHKAKGFILCLTSGLGKNLAVEIEVHKQPFWKCTSFLLRNVAMFHQRPSLSHRALVDCCFSKKHFAQLASIFTVNFLIILLSFCKYLPLDKPGQLLIT